MPPLPAPKRRLKVAGSGYPFQREQGRHIGLPLHALPLLSLMQRKIPAAQRARRGGISSFWLLCGGGGNFISTNCVCRLHLDHCYLYSGSHYQKVCRLLVLTVRIYCSSKYALLWEYRFLWW